MGDVPYPVVEVVQVPVDQPRPVEVPYPVDVPYEKVIEEVIHRPVPVERPFVTTRQVFAGESVSNVTAPTQFAGVVDQGTVAAPPVVGGVGALGAVGAAGA